MKYDDAMDYITQIGNYGSNYGLERTYRLLELLGNPHKETKYIHVAGTNGKGSTTAMITKILVDAGYKVGMYTSPFLEEFEERIQINHQNIPKDVLAKLIGEVKLSVDKVIEEGYNHPTEFEIITVLMLLYFYREGVDFAVIEVGLGGRLDSTNVITPILSIITSISKDHENLLGNTLYKIAREKAGIIKENIPTVIFPQKKEAVEVILETCALKKSKLYNVNCDDFKLKAIDKENLYSIIQGKFNGESIEIELPLLGEHQVTNAAVAIKAIEILINENYCNISKEILINSLRSVSWKGRFEVISKKPIVLIDGAHNPQGIKVLSDNIDKYFTYKNIYLIIGVLKDKDIDEMLSIIGKKANEIITLKPNSPRGLESSILKEKMLKYNQNTKAMSSYKEAYDYIKIKSTSEDLILICGSLYMIGDFRKGLTKKWN